MLRRSKYKFLIKLRHNIWNSSKPLKFKKLKWRKIRRVLFFNFFRKRKRSRKKLKKRSKKKYFFLERFEMKHFFNEMLNTKKMFSNTFGPYKRNQISKIIKKSFKVGFVKKSYNIGFNKVTVGNLKYYRVIHLMQSLESKLLTVFSRLEIFSNLFVYLHFIKCGYVLVNGRIIKNPFFNLREGDVVSLKIYKKKKIKKINKRGSMVINFRSYRKTYKRLNCKSKHLVFLYKNPKIIFVKNPDFYDVGYLSVFHWGLLHYLLKLKR
jgi:ribosomal protein S4